MKREDQVKFCSQCTHRKMDFKKGLLCGLTNEIADFEGTCPDFDQEKVVEKEMQDNNFSSGTEISVITADEKPKKYWNYLGYFALATTVMVLLRGYLYIYSVEGNDVNNEFLYKIVFKIFSAALWVFIGWETNRLKNGLIAGGILIVATVILDFIPLPNFFLFYYLPFILAATFFAIFSLSDNNKRSKFVVFSLIICLGMASLSFFYNQEAMKILDQILYGLFGMDTDFSAGFITWEVTTSEGYQYDYPLDWLFGKLLADLFMFMTITYLYKCLQGQQKWGFHLVQLGRRISQQKMALYVFIFYAGLVIFSFGIMGQVKHFFEWTLNSPWAEESVLSNSIEIIIRVSSALVLITFIIGLYRKILLEYYLDRSQSISWNFYFGQLPIIGFFVWLYNLTNFKLTKTLDNQKIKRMAAKEDGLKVFLIIIASLYVILLIAFVSNIGGQIPSLLLAFLFISIGIYALYLYNEFGVYILVGLQFLGFLIFVVLQILGADLPEGIMSHGLFWSMTQAFLLYPAFHLNKFSVTLPPQQDELAEELI